MQSNAILTATYPVEEQYIPFNQRILWQSGQNLDHSPLALPQLSFTHYWDAFPHQSYIPIQPIDLSSKLSGCTGPMPSTCSTFPILSSLIQYLIPAGQEGLLHLAHSKPHSIHQQSDHSPVTSLQNSTSYRVPSPQSTQQCPMQFEQKELSSEFSRCTPMISNASPRAVYSSTTPNSIPMDKEMGPIFIHQVSIEKSNIFTDASIEPYSVR